MKNNRDTILITGSTGFIGYNFSKYLISKGFNVHLLVRKTSNLMDLEKREHTVVNFYNGKSDSIKQVFNKNRIDFVFHLATHYDKSDDPLNLVKLNNVCIGLTSQLFEVIKDQKYSIGFINVGTVWQVHESIENAYTLFKVFQEELVKFYSNKYEIKSLSLLLNDTYGPNDLRPKLLNKIKTSVRENKEINIMNPNTTINLVYIDDVCDALHHSINLLKESNICFNRYKIQDKTSINLRNLIDLCETILSRQMNVKYGNETQISKVILSNKVEDLPDWEPKFDKTYGLVQFFDDKEQNK